MMRLLSVTLCCLLSSPDWRVRDWVTRHTPWSVMVVLVSPRHPDNEVRLRWRKVVPAWYKELNPVFFRCLVSKSDLVFSDPATWEPFLRTADRYYTWYLNPNDVSASVCAGVLLELRSIK